MGGGELFSYYFARLRSRNYVNRSFHLLIRNKADANSPVRRELAICGGPLGIGMESKPELCQDFQSYLKSFSLGISKRHETTGNCDILKSSASSF